MRAAWRIWIRKGGNEQRKKCQYYELFVPFETPPPKKYSKIEKYIVNLQMTTTGN